MPRQSAELAARITGPSGHSQPRSARGRYAQPMSAQLFGRDAEMRTMGAFIGSLPRTAGALVLAGPPGAGKTTLLKAGVALAGEHRITVLGTAPTWNEVAGAAARTLFVIDTATDQIRATVPVGRGATSVAAP